MYMGQNVLGVTPVQCQLLNIKVCVPTRLPNYDCSFSKCLLEIRARTWRIWGRLL